MSIERYSSIQVNSIFSGALERPPPGWIIDLQAVYYFQKYLIASTGNTSAQAGKEVMQENLKLLI